MKTIKILLLLCCLPFIALSQEKTDEETIKNLINTAYIEGLQNGGDLNVTRDGFWPGFELLVYKTSVVEKLPIYNWIKISEERRAKETQKTDIPKIICKFLLIDVTGNAAIAKIELSRKDEKLFTDYLSLYKLDSGWKIVGKIYHRHPLPVPSDK